MPGDDRKTIYYPINEDAAKRAKEINSFSDYRPFGHIRSEAGGEYEREFCH